MRTSGASILTLVVLASGCQTTSVELPSNVFKTAAAAGQPAYIEKIDFTYKPQTPPSFSKVKLCVAENVTNQAVQLRDAAGSFVGQATGTYYRANNTQTQSGGEVFKFADDSIRTLVATGTTTTNPSGMAIVRDIVRFDLKVALKDSGTELVFQNITRAQQDTGISANTGFAPVGTWPGARSPEIYTALESLAQKVKSCAQ